MMTFPARTCIFKLLALCLAVSGAARTTFDKDKLPSNNEAVEAIFTLVESLAVPPDDDRGLWAGINAIPRIENEFKQAFESTWGVFRVHNKCSDECMQVCFTCHGKCKRDQSFMFTLCHRACQEAETECLTACLHVKDESTE